GQAEVAADDRHLAAGGAVVGQGQVAGAGADVEDGGVALRRHEARGAPAPVAVNVKAEQVVEQVVARGDVAEHAADAGLTLVEQGRGHRRLRGVRGATRGDNLVLAERAPERTVRGPE